MLCCTVDILHQLSFNKWSNRDTVIAFFYNVSPTNIIKSKLWLVLGQCKKLSFSNHCSDDKNLSLAIIRTIL